MPLARLVEQPGHHLAQDPAPPVARQDADAGDPGGAHLAAGDGQPERVGAAAADDVVAVERTDEPIELDRPPVVLDRGVAELLVERDRQRAR